MPYKLDKTGRALEANAGDATSWKAGARNSADDLERLQQIHDLACANGAVCHPDAAAETPAEEAGESMADEQAGKHMKVMAGATSSDFLVVEDPKESSKWHLQVKQGGKIDPRLLGAAHAALLSPGGFRGNKYEGPNKQEAISKLKALYKEAGLTWPEDSGKSLNLTYIKSLRLPEDVEYFRDVVAVKTVGRDIVRGYLNLWGDSKTTDLEAEYFTKATNFWDDRLAMPRPLTWDHAQDAATKAEPVIGSILEMGDDETGRWYVAQLDRAHKYRKAVDALISTRDLGTSSDSAPQYVERVKTGKSTWLKTWPLFAGALTTTPCEPRMLDAGSLFWKSIATDLDGRTAALDSATKEARLRWLDIMKLSSEVMK